MTIALLFAVLAAAPSTGSKQGGVPSILVNPDTLVTSSSVSISDLRNAARDVLELEGGHFGVAVKDFQTGESFVETEGGTFDIGSPELIVCACAIDLDRSGVMPLDTISSRNETIGDQIIMAREGNLEALTRITGRVQPDLIRPWLARKGFSSTTFSGIQLYWPGAPQVEPNKSTPSDCMGMLSLIESRLDEAEIRRLVRNPFTRTDLEDLQGGSATLYGFSSRGLNAGECRAAIVSMPGGRRVGIVVLADDLCCAGKADVAFRMLWESL